jgi:hypothetical protein
VGVLVVGRKATGRVDGGLVDADGFLVDGAVARRVDGAADVDLLAVGWLNTRTVLTLDVIDLGAVGAVGGVYFDAGIGVGRVRSVGRRKCFVSPGAFNVFVPVP